MCSNKQSPALSLHFVYDQLAFSGRLDAEMDTATRRMASVLDKLPREITPQNLEELRRVKQALVELESKADQLR